MKQQQQKNELYAENVCSAQRTWAKNGDNYMGMISIYLSGQSISCYNCKHVDECMSLWNNLTQNVSILRLSTP